MSYLHILSYVLYTAVTVIMCVVSFGICFAAFTVIRDVWRERK